MTATFGPGDVDRFRALVDACLGLRLDDAKSTFLEDVLHRRLEILGSTSAAYLAQLRRGSNEVRELARELTVGETYFFRNREQFSALAEIALPARMEARASSRRLRMLSAGCASGDEAYSLSIVAQQTAGPSWEIAILAVDVNPSVLEKARRARYSPWALRETTPEVERRWFRTEGKELVLDEAARALVHFEERNLVEDDPRLWQPEVYDVVFCRNALMYFAPANAKAVVDRIARSLAPGGYLFLGHAETLRGLTGDFHLCHTHGTFYYQRRERLEGGRAEPSLESAPAMPLGPPVAVASGGGESWVETIRQASERIDALTTPRSPAKAVSGASPGYRRELGAALHLLEKEQYAEALDRVSALPPGAAPDLDALLLRVVLLTHSGRLAEAEEASDQLLAIDELNAGAHYAVALCREARGDRQGALDHDQLAIYLDPSFAMPRLHLGLLARKRGDLPAARRELGQALELLQREDAARLLLFGGGFTREALLALCRAELASCGGPQ